MPSRVQGHSLIMQVIETAKTPYHRPRAGANSTADVRIYALNLGCFKLATRFYHLC